MKGRSHRLVGFLAIGLGMVGCAYKTPLTEVQKLYAGRWTAEDGSFVQIYFDGRGDYTGSGRPIEGVPVSISDDRLAFGPAPVAYVYRITQSPQEKEGKWTMHLNNIEYKKE
jgi:hypothetical protein